MRLEFASARGVSLEANSALIVAALDLSLVRLLRSAIRTADLTVASERSINRVNNAYVTHRCCCNWTDCPTTQPAPLIPAVDRYEPSNTIVVTEPERPQLLPAMPLPVEAVVVRERDPLESPLQPPWKVLPWENPPRPVQNIKVVHYQPDIVCKGSVLDCFI